MEIADPVSRLADFYELFDTDPGPVVGFLKWVVESHGMDMPRVLDVGCGPGRLLAEFSRFGWPVEGFEPDPVYFERATGRAAGWRDVVVRRGGFGDIEPEPRFDLVVAMNGPFAYLLCTAEREDAARRVFGALRPGGILVLDLANFPWLLKNYRAPPHDRRTIDGATVTRIPTHSLDRGLNHLDLVVWLPLGSGAGARAKRSFRRLVDSHLADIIGTDGLGVLSDRESPQILELRGPTSKRLAILAAWLERAESDRATL